MTSRKLCPVRTIVYIWFSVVAIFPTFLTGITVHDGADDTAREAIRAKALEIGNGLPGLGYALGERANGQLIRAGSIVKISDTLAISAGHVSYHFQDGDYKSMKIGFGSFTEGINGSETTYEVLAIARHPNIDLAVFSLGGLQGAGIPDAEYTTTTLTLDQLVHFGGYGLLSHEGGSPIGNANKLGARGYIGEFSHPDFPEYYHYVEFNGTQSAPTYHAEGGLVASGDSGGGVYILEGSGEYKLVGFNTVLTGLNEYGEFSGFLPLSLPTAHRFLHHFLDTDKDGNSDLLEEAFGSNALAPQTSPSSQLQTSFGDGQQWILSHLGLSDGSITYQGQFSEDLQAWEDAAPAANPPGLPAPPTNYVWMTWEAPTQATKGFLRIQAEADLSAP